MKAVTKPALTKTPPILGRGKASVRLPQRSEAVAGDEANGDATPIAAAQKKKPQQK